MKLGTAEKKNIGGRAGERKINVGAKEMPPSRTVMAAFPLRMSRGAGVSPAFPPDDDNAGVRV